MPAPFIRILRAYAGSVAAAVALAASAPALERYQFSSPAQPYPTVEPSQLRRVDLNGDGITDVLVHPSDDLFGEEMPAELPLQGRGAAMAAEGESGDAALAQIKALLGASEIKRSPADIVGALAERATETERNFAPRAPEPGAPGAELFRPSLAVHLVTGDWPAIGNVFSAMPTEQRHAVYGGLLALIFADEEGVLAPIDVLHLADLSPSELDEKQLEMLGMLLARSMAATERPASMLAAMKRPGHRVGGDSPAGRTAAARLLIAAGLLEEAASYLPPVEAAGKRSAPAMNLHARYFLGVARTKVDGESPEKALARVADANLKAWTLTMQALRLPDASGQDINVATQAALRLAPRVPPPLASAWLDAELKGADAQAIYLISQIVIRAPVSFASRDPEERTDAIRLIHLAGEQILASRAGGLKAEADGAEAVWTKSLAMLARGWVNEAQKTAGGPLRKLVHSDDDKIEPLPGEVVLAAAPSAAWRKQIDPDAATHMAHLAGILAARAGDEGATFSTLAELSPGSPGLARQIAEALVLKVSGAPTEEEQSVWESYGSFGRSRGVRNPFGGSHYVSHSVYDGSSQSTTATTRAGQLRKLAALAELLGKLKELGAPRPADHVLVQAFSASHASAEVYRQSDIEAVFGQVDQIPSATTAALADTLRTNLAGIWRDPQLQQQSGAKRTPQDHAAEVVRGYQLGETLLAREAPGASPREAIERQMRLAGFYFDHSEFLYGQQVDLATYARLRDAAFRGFQSAAAAYARLASVKPDEAASVEVYRRWFQAALGASDLAYLTRQDEPDKTQIEQIAVAISSLSATAAEKHRGLFAAAIAESLDQTPAQLKPHVVRQALLIAGDHPGAKPLADRLTYYNELLSEVELRLAIDGGDRVGARRSFGVHVFIRGTRSVFRENEAFAALLVAGPNAAADSPRGALEKELREKLSESFDIEALAFHPAAARPHNARAEGWQQRPLAYAVLRAKNESVDRLPPVQIDIDFADGGQPVRLPIRSQVALLDARSEPEARPVRETAVRMLLDDRQLDEGRAALEITATARGVVPPLDALLAEAAAPVDGFDEAKISDHGISIASLESTDAIEAQTERRWTIEYPLASGARPESFVFPAMRSRPIALTLQRYDDADVAAADAAAPLRYGAISEASRWLWPAVAGAALLLIAGAAFVYLRRREKAAPPEASYRWPQQVTPFSLLAILRQMQNDASLRLGPEERRELGAAVRKIEERHFAPQATVGSGDMPDLDATLRRWFRHTGASNGHV